MILASIIAHHADAESLQVKVLDGAGAGFPDVLVIVKSLEGKGEVFRALTDATGSVPIREVAPGIYRAIATCPYGICQTSVQEFYVKNVPVHLELTALILPTQGNVVEIGPTSLLKVEILDRVGKPAKLAPVLIRDPDVQHERWYKTDADGSTTVELLNGPMTVVVLFGGTLTSKTMSLESANDLKAKGMPLIIRAGGAP